jgi:hypothetical protein
MDPGARTPGPSCRRSLAAHRRVVLNRLLERGISPTTLAALLPDFRPLIEELAAHD